MLNLENVYGDNSTDIIATAIVLASCKIRGEGAGWREERRVSGLRKNENPGTLVCLPGRSNLEN